MKITCNLIECDKGLKAIIEKNKFFLPFLQCGRQKLIKQQLEFQLNSMNRD